MHTYCSLRYGRSLIHTFPNQESHFNIILQLNTIRNMYCKLLVIKIHTEETWFNVNICRMASVCLAKRLFSRPPFIAMLDASAQVCLIFPGGNLDFQTLFQTFNSFQVFFKFFKDSSTDWQTSWETEMFWWCGIGMVLNKKRLHLLIVSFLT